MRRHGFDPISLVFGVIFAGLGLVFLFGDVEVGHNLPQAWTWPIPLVIVGVLIILLAVRRDRPPGRDLEPTGALDSPAEPLPWETLEPPTTIMPTEES